MRAQQPIWLSGNELIDFNDVNGTGIQTKPLPISTSSTIDDDFEYKGQIAQYSQNVQYDENGDLLFFVQDGNVYNCDGLLIADGTNTIHSSYNDCQSCIYRGDRELVIVPVPGSCTKFYLISGFPYDGYPSQQAQNGGNSAPPSGLNNAFLRLSILDMGVKNDLKKNGIDYYSSLGMNVNGRLSTDAELATSYLDVGPGIPDHSLVFNSNTDYRAFDIQLPTNGPNDQHVKLEVVDLDNSTNYLLIVELNNQIQLYRIESDRIRTAGLFDKGQNNVGIVDDGSQRSELATKQVGNNLRIGHGSYWLSAGGGTPAHVLAVGYWDFDISGIFNPIPTVVLNNTAPLDNPRIYTPTIYDVSNLQTDIDGNLVDEPRVAGLEFSPNGQYLYFLLSSHQNIFSSNFGFIDVLETDPTLVPQWLSYAPIGDQIQYIDSELELNEAPYGGTDMALYFIRKDGSGNYWFDAFVEPDFPDPNSLILGQQLNSVALLDHPSPVEYRLLTNNITDAYHLGTLASLDCCEGVLAMKDRSTTIAAGSYQWLPGSNSFFNTDKEIFIETELRIATGAQVYLSDMTFKFGQNAKLIIEQGASFIANNCTFTHACEDQRWKGIEAWGTTNIDQSYGSSPTAQAYLSMGNCTVEFADIGILTGQQSVKGTTGAVVYFSNSTMRNCAQGIYFRPYQNFDPGSNNNIANRGRILNSEFFVDQDYVGSYDFQEHVRMWKVDGVRFKNCEFRNDWTDAQVNADGMGSGSLGYGIHSLDAKFDVNPGCNTIQPFGQPCPNANITPSTFIGLDHGIHAAVTKTARRFLVEHASFDKNICGVYAETIPGFTVRNSDFTIGERDVMLTNPQEQLWQNRHRGIYGDHSYNFTIRDNTFTGSQAPDAALAEGVVIGNSNGHNDVIFRNVGSDLENGFVGEGICSEPNNRPGIGLQFICNTINAFDYSGEEFHSSTTNNIINYQWTNPTVPFEPQAFNFPFVAKNDQNVVRDPDNCNFIVSPIEPDPNDVVEVQLSGWQQILVNEKSNYVNTRYAYEQLIDGGSTDALVQQVQQSWPEDAWQLRNDLLAKSPYLSTELLMETVEHNILPQAMLTEVLVANPEATQQGGFLEWLQWESGHPLPQYMVDQIVASWNTETYRSFLEAQMGEYHANMSLALNAQTELLQTDTTDQNLDSLFNKWGQLGTVAGTYAQAITALEQGNLNTAESLVLALDPDEDVEPQRYAEKQRFLDLVQFFRELENASKDETELDMNDINALKTIVDNSYDRPAGWAQNLLCFGYSICRSPQTGGSGTNHTPIFISHTNSAAESIDELNSYPNPADSYATLTFQIKPTAEHVELVICDALGKIMEQLTLSSTDQQALLDTREWAEGSYMAELRIGDKSSGSKKIIIQH